MTKAALIAYLRQSCIIQDPSGVTPIDPVFLSLTDDQISLVLQVAVGKVCPSELIDSLPDDFTYPVILTAQKELYFQLASNSAPLFPISADGASLQKNIRFDHYMTLVSAVSAEYQSFLNTGAQIAVGNLTLGSRYYTQRNLDLAKKPVIVLNVDEVFTDHVHVSWRLSNIDRFSNVKLYIGSSEIVNIYAEESLIISAEAVLLATITDLHRTVSSVGNLTANTHYHIAAVVQEKNGLKGYSEITVTTLLA